MSKLKLVIAEKTSVAKTIAAVLGANERKEGYYQGNGYIVSWCVGHLLELAPPAAYNGKYAKWNYGDLPILPGEFQYIVPDSRQKQFFVLGGLLADKRVDTVINACDAGREGELIFRLVYMQCECTKPVQRLWISSMEDAAIREGFTNLQDGAEYDNLYHAALCRAQADWLVGINATRLFSVLYGATLNVGRVMTPTLALLAKREAAIQAFVKEVFYVPEIECGGFTAESERLPDKETAENIRAACDGQPASVLSVETEHKTVQPPKLFDLTSLQREANRLYGFTAQQTLDYLQSLYEKKLATYPRTDSKYLTEDMRDMTSDIVRHLQDRMPFAQPDLAPNIGQIINNSKVTDHHAIIPTAEIANADLAALPAGERDVLLLVVARLLCATAEKHDFDAVTATLECEGYRFIAKGKATQHEGWKEIETAFKATLNDADNEQDGDGKRLPELQEGQRFEKVVASVREGQTAPPKHFTEDTLLAAMETAGAEDTGQQPKLTHKGLGTPATRAGTIEKLVKVGFVERKKKQLLPTPKGIDLIAVLPDTIKSPQLTAEWEHQLKQMERGEAKAETFMEGILQMTHSLVVDHSTPIEEYKALFTAPPKAGREVVGVCPRCGRNVHEIQKGFICENRACTFALWKDDRFFTNKRKRITKFVAAALLKEGRFFMSGLYSAKSGKIYDAFVVLDDTGEKYINFKLEFLH